MGIGEQISDILGYKPSAPASNGALPVGYDRVAPEVQQERDRTRATLLDRERQVYPDDANLQREAAGARRRAEAAPIAAPAPAKGMGAQVLSELGIAEPAASTPEAPPARPAPTPVEVSANPVGAPKPKSADREVVHALASGLGHTITGGLSGLWALAKSGGDTEAAAAAVRAEQEKAYQPKGEVAQAATEVIGSSNYNPLNWIPNASKAVAEKGAEKGLLSPSEAAAIEAGGAVVGPGALLKGMKGAQFFKRVTPPVAERPAMGSAGAAAATDKAAAVNASPDLARVIDKAQGTHPVAITRQLEADSLPVPMKLTEGQATGDVAQISHEYNNKAKYPQIAERFKEQGETLHKNVEAIRDEVAPDVYGADHVQNGRSIIDAYREHDAALRSAISAKYKALEEANGGKFPVDGVAFADSAEAALGKALKTDYVPSPVAKQLERFKAGEQMDFEKFEALRTNLASDIRSSSDGNVRHAASIVLNALESIPMSGEAAALKPMADAARAAAKARFDLLKKDPAYKAVVNNKIAPDDFIQRFVINGKVDNVKTMIENLQPGSAAHQTMAAGVLNHLQKSAGADFNQKAFNNGLRSMSPDGKLLAIMGQKAAGQLETLGKVADYTQRLPRGHSANTSHTLVGSLAEHGKNVAEVAVNSKIPFAGTMIRSHLAKRAEQKAVTRALQTGAGIDLRDVAKR